MKIAGMVLWVLTAGIGIYLLAAGIAAQRQAAGLRRPAGAGPAGESAGPAGESAGPAGESARAAGEGAGAADDGSVLAPAGERADSLAPGPDGATVVGAAALASITAPDGGAAPGAGGPEAEGSPLLEFMHPLLALTGLTFWIFFVMTDDRLFARIALGVVVAAVLAGLSWAAATRRAAGRAGRRTAAFPAHLVMIHGLAAACTLTLVVISALTAAHT